MSKIDSLLEKIKIFEKIAVLSDKKEFLRSIAQENMTPSGSYNENPDYGTPNSSEGVPATFGDNTVVQSSPVKPKLISKDIQKKLNDLLVPNGKIFPLDIDGVYGDKTDGAINVFKKEYNVGNVSDQEVIKAIMSATPKTVVSVSPEDPVYNALETPGPVTAALTSKIDLFYKMSQRK